MPILLQAEYIIGDLCIRYIAPSDRPAAWGLQMLPASLANHAVTPREWLDSAAVRKLPAPWNRTRAWEVDPLVHVHVAGDPYPGGFAQGRTLRNSATAQRLAVISHAREQRVDRVMLLTELRAENDLQCRHELTVDPATGTVAVQITVRNSTAQPMILEHLGAFSLSGLTPFASDDAPGLLWVHRFRSAWSAEGRHETRRVEELLLERSWTGHGVRSERFGQVGSLPVNGWFPFVGLEDRGAGVTWAAQLAAPGTWHLEVYRRADQLALAGGGADQLAGEWRHNLASGESFAAPPAFLTAVAGSIDEACDRLLGAARQRANPPDGEEKLPVIFNEWCTSWGHPTHDSLVALADLLAGTGVRYLVIDDGWAERPGDQFQQAREPAGIPGRTPCDHRGDPDPRTRARDLV
jgi:alpha-galactosidase